MCNKLLILHKSANWHSQWTYPAMQMHGLGKERNFSANEYEK